MGEDCWLQDRVRFQVLPVRPAGQQLSARKCTGAEKTENHDQCQSHFSELKVY